MEHSKEPNEFIVHQTLKLQNLMRACEHIKECEIPLNLLKAEIPLGMNYHYSWRTVRITSELGIELGATTKAHAFDGYNFGFFSACTGNRNATFSKTSLTFQEQINIRLLKVGCKLQVSKLQDYIISNLYDLKNKHEKTHCVGYVDNCLAF